jgi:hypothetical protein
MVKACPRNSFNIRPGKEAYGGKVDKPKNKTPWTSVTNIREKFSEW